MKWLLPIWKGKNKKEPFNYGLQDYIRCFWQQDNGGAMSTFYALIKGPKDETHAFQIDVLC